MHALSKLLTAVAFVFASLLSGTARCAPQVLVLSESFDDISRLSAWSNVNASTPQGLSWFQGNAGIFPAFQGPPSSYIAASYLSAGNGSGTVDNWLITPPVALWGASLLSFATRTDALPGFADRLEIRFSPNGSQGDPADFTVLLGTIGGAGPYPVSWQQFAFDLDYAGTGRFAFRYLGDAAQLNYIGLDMVTITTVAEPALWPLLLAGLGLLALRRRHFQESTS
jgi:hypothetical protein